MSVDFEKVIEMGKARKARAQERKRLTLENITAEQLDEMLYRVEHFHGTTENLEAIERYNRVKDTAVWLFIHYHGIDRWGEIPACPESRNAQIWLDLCQAAFFTNTNAQAWRMLNDLADCVYLIRREGEDAGVRVSFVVKNVMGE